MREIDLTAIAITLREIHTLMHLFIHSSHARSLSSMIQIYTRLRRLRRWVPPLKTTFGVVRHSLQYTAREDLFIYFVKKPLWNQGRENYF